VDPNGKTHLLRGAQEQLRRNESRLQAMLKACPDVITTVDRVGIILSQNPAAQRVFGFSPRELLGHNLFAFVHEADVAAVGRDFLSVVEGASEQATVEFRHRTENGSYQQIEAAIGRVRDETPLILVLSLRPRAARQDAPCAP